MTRASDNAFPSILITEGTEPSAPAAGKQRLYIDSTTHHLMRTNSSGVETDVEGGLQNAHGCKISRDTSDQSLGNNTFTAVQWNATDTIDTDAMHDPASNNTRITIPTITGVTTGLWEFVTHGYTTATSPRTDMKLRKGGSTDYEIIVGPTTPSGVGAFNGSWLVSLAAADYIELMLRTTGGSFSLVATDATALPFLMAKFLGKLT